MMNVLVTSDAAEESRAAHRQLFPAVQSYPYRIFS